MTFEENNGIYSFDTVESDGGTSPNAAYSSTNGYIQGWWRDIVNGKYSGELEITVLSGKKAAFVRYPDGTREAVNSGEVSVRGLYGYVT